MKFELVFGCHQSGEAGGHWAGPGAGLRLRPPAVVNVKCDPDVESPMARRFLA
ncbi:MAG: hypothetical protein Q8P59_06970 [Dehalococcoidia bacterium]|nr:hypothetical protein [Dehalococcoidia bacterium]